MQLVAGGPVFSIVVPTYCRPERLKECLAAIRRLEFDASAFEVIVVDDGGSPPVDLPRDWPPPIPAIQLIRQPRRGPAAARNAGVRSARGKYLAFLDDDCRPDPGWLQAWAAALEQTPSALLGGGVENGEPGNRCAVFNHTLSAGLMAVTAGTGNWFFPSNNLCVAASEFAAAGGFDESFPGAAGEDREFCARWQRSGRPMRTVSQARVTHHHPQTLAAFWAMHRRYGAAANQVAALRPDGSRSVDKVALFRFTAGRAPLELLCLSQIAVASGYFALRPSALMRYAARFPHYLARLPGAMAAQFAHRGLGEARAARRRP